MRTVEKILVYQALMDILSDRVTRSTEQVLAEFSAEYPQYIKSIQNAWVDQNGFNCGAIQHPATIISQTLEELSDEGKVTKTIHKLKLWTLT